METLEKFDDFIKKLRSGKREKEIVNNLILDIETVLRNQKQFHSPEFIISGALKRETMLRSNPTAELIFAMNRKFMQFKELVAKTEKILRDNFLDIKRISGNRFLLKFKHEEIEGDIEILVYVSYKVNSPRQMSELRRPDNYRGYGSKFQSQYINKQRATFKRFASLVVLMKYWKRLYDVPIRDLHIELLAPVAIERVGELDWPKYITNFFEVVLDFTDGIPIKPVGWEKRFSNEEIHAKPQAESGVLIVDPANPNNNIAYDINAEMASKIKEEAQKALDLSLAQDWNSLFETNAL